MVNSMHLLMSALRVNVSFEWVLLEANSSNLPSRVDEVAAYELFHQLFPGSTRGPSVQPPRGWQH